PQALREVEHLLSGDPRDADALNLKAAIHMRAADYEAAISGFRQVLEMHPREPGVWSSLGHALRTVGRREECMQAYRKALALTPDFGEAAWNLANLKTYRISDTELGSMRAQLEKPDLPARDRVHFDFAIGKALEDRGAYEESFRFYAEGNRPRASACGAASTLAPDQRRSSRRLPVPTLALRRRSTAGSR